MRSAESCHPWAECWDWSNCSWENLVLRHQLNILRRRAARRVRLCNVDRLVFVWLYRLYPAVAQAVTIVKPETIIGWHRRGYRAFWRWKSRSKGGRPPVPREIRDLIREMSRVNWLWGAPRIHGELLKLGIEVAQATVGKQPQKSRASPLLASSHCCKCPRPAPISRMDKPGVRCE